VKSQHIFARSNWKGGRFVRLAPALRFPLPSGRDGSPPRRRAGGRRAPPAAAPAAVPQWRSAARHGVCDSQSNATRRAARPRDRAAYRSSRRRAEIFLRAVCATSGGAPGAPNCLRTRAATRLRRGASAVPPPCAPRRSSTVSHPPLIFPRGKLPTVGVGAQTVASRCTDTCN
jgi:hypothetical protein